MESPLNKKSNNPGQFSGGAGGSMEPRRRPAPCTSGASGFTSGESLDSPEVNQDKPMVHGHLLPGCSSWAGSFRTLLAVGRRSAAAAGEFPGLLSRPADSPDIPRIFQNPT